MADVSELNEIDSAQTALNIASKRLRAAQRLGELRLSQTCLHSTLL